MSVSVESIERATLAAVAPRVMEELGDWLLPLESGPVGRAKSAVPLRHGGLDPAHVAEIEARYRAHGLVPRFRIADVPELEALRGELAARGLEPHQPTWVQLASVERLLTERDAASRRAVQEPIWAQRSTQEPVAAQRSVQGPSSTERAVEEPSSAQQSVQEPASAQRTLSVAASADESWTRTFVGVDASPLVGEQRMAMLARNQTLVFASVREHGEALAVGAAAFSHGLMCVLGMRTAEAQRGHGLAHSVLIALAERARTLGIDHVVLQVEAENAPALALYRRAGFEPAWCYRYWYAA